MIRNDFLFAIRQLRKNPGFAAVAIFTLALGICASLTIFSFVYAALIKPLPYQQPSRLAALYESGPLGPRFNLSYPDYLDWKDSNNVFSSMDAYAPGIFLLSTPAGAEHIDVGRVTEGFFRTLGVTPVLGRDFNPGEDSPSVPRTVMLSYAAWQKRFGGRTDVLGQTITLSGAPNTIIGVLPRGFHFAPAEPAEFWKTLREGRRCRRCRNLYGVARLKDGVSIQTASAEMKLIAERLEKQYPDSNSKQGATVLPLSEVIVGDIRPTLLALLSGAALLLLITCVNVVSLLLIRSEGRKREIGIRRALGASPARLVRQFVIEGLVLVVAGGILGLAITSFAIPLVTKLIPTDMIASMPYLQELGLSVPVVILAGSISLVTVALFALIPAVRLSLSDIRDGLTEGNRSSAGTMRRRLGANVVVVELAIAIVLLAGAGLLWQSFYRLMRVNIGFQPDHLATLEIESLGYGSDELSIGLERTLVSRFAELPGVMSVGIASGLPVGDGSGTRYFSIIGDPSQGKHNEVNYRIVNHAYFTTLQARLLRGRYFTEFDALSKPRVVIINQAMAKHYFPREDPVGKNIDFGADTGPSDQSMEIVGVIDNIKEGPLEMEVRPAMYVPSAQSPMSSFSVVVRSSQPEQSVLSTLAATIRQINPGISVYREAAMRDRIHRSPSAYLQRSAAWMVGGFAAMSVLLSVVGLYGVISYAVSRRTREIGVRMALGAQRGSVYLLILKEAGLLTACGIALGLIGWVATATLIRKLLFGIGSFDIPTLAAVVVLLAISAMPASFLPARRAASVNPVEALRAE